ncbi:MAG: hypothetical protein FIB06_01230 [Betaproteobacteria bacterium]|nr:hypothetical protein [Betaproteobacteria bacterium]
MFSNLTFGSVIGVSVALAGIYILVCFAWGRLVVRYIANKPDWATSFAVGHAVLAIILQLIAVAGFFNWYSILPLAVPTIWALRSFRWAAAPFVRVRQLLWPTTPLKALVALLVFVLCVLLLVDTVSYPGTDALAYYMAQPKLFAATGRYAPLLGYEGFSVLPALAEMPFGVMYVFGGETVGQLAGKLLIWPVFATILAMLWNVGRRLGLSSDAALLLMVVGATSSALTLVVWDGKTDLIALMYALVALQWLPGLFSWDDDRRSLIAFGAISACAVMAKLSYALILPFALGIPLLLFRANDLKGLFRILALAGVGAVLLFTAGWWLKNFMLYGDPLAPILSFQSTTPKFATEQSWFDPEKTGWILKTYPLAVTFGLYPMQHGGISAMWLVLLPALWTRPWQLEGGRKALYLATGGIVALIVWMVLRPSVIAPRYIFPALLWPSFLLAFGFDQWRSNRSVFANIAQLAAMVLLVLQIQYAATVWNVHVRPLVASLRGQPGVLALRDRANLISPRDACNKILLLSYSSEPLPFRHLAAFVPYTGVSKDDSVYEWAAARDIDCIVYDPITHKRADFDEPAPSGYSVEKIELAPNAYLLLRLQSTVK